MTATKTKRKGIFLALPVLALLFLISTSMMSGTFAKYTSALSGADTALVARWNITNGDTKQQFDTTLEIFNHNYNQHITQQADGKYLIAPGVKDDFIVKIFNDSDVDAYIDFTFAKSGAATTVPLQYTIHGTAVPAVTDVNSLDETLKAYIIDKSDEAGDKYYGKVTVATDGRLILAKGEAIDETIDWEWVFNNGTDGTDSTIGNTSATSANRTDYVVTLAITAEQVAPVVS